MADFTSHLLNGKQIIADLDNREAKKIIEDNLFAFNVGLQGPDILYYHRVQKGGNALTKAGTWLHEDNIDNLIIEIQKYINNITDIKTKEILLSYLFGFISHYNLDKYIHVFVGHEVNKLFENQRSVKPKKLRTNADLHQKFEMEIDVAMHKRFTGKKVQRFKIYKHYNHQANQRSIRAISGLYYVMLENLYEKSQKTIKEISDIQGETEEAIVSTIELNKLFYKSFMTCVAKFLNRIGKVPFGFVSHFKQKTKLDASEKKKYTNDNTGELFNESLEDIFERATQESVRHINMLFTASTKMQVAKTNCKLGFINGL